MRDFLVSREKYFIDFIDSKKEIINHLLSEINSEKVKDENLPRTKHLAFVKSMELLIAKYSKGDSIDSIKSEFSSTLNYMVDGWDDQVVKFKKGRPQVIYDKYMLNEYCYMIWMLSLAILLDVSQNEKDTLNKIIGRGNIDDELILLLLNHMCNKDVSKMSKTTYKPFSGIVKSGQLINNPKSMKTYLEKWYANTKLLMWHNYKSSIETTQYYYGYWSFESAAVTCIIGLDDSSYRDNQFYPKDLVDYYRENHPT